MTRVETTLQALLDWLPPGVCDEIEFEWKCHFAEDARHYASVDLSVYPPNLGVCPDLEYQPRERILGVLAHETGHIIDPTADEREADRAAEEAFDLEIFYDEEDVQCAGPNASGNRPRPPRLPR